MLPGSQLLSRDDISTSRLVDAVRGESKEDAVIPRTPEDTANLSMTPAQNSVFSSSDSNASSSIVSERGKKPVWGRTSNGAMDTGLVVMGGSDSWPALTESTKTSIKISSEGLSSGHVNSSSTPRKFSKRNGGGNDGDEVGTSGSFSRNGGPSSPLPLPSSAEMSGQLDKGSYSNRERGPRELHGWVDHGNRQRRLGVTSRRGNNGNRRDQERAVHEWSSSRISSGRDFHMQRGQLRLPVMQPPMPAMVPFVGHPPFQSYPGPMALPDFSYQGFYFPAFPYPETFGGNPFAPRAIVPPMQLPMLSASEYQQRISLLKQIEYYFSLDNLCKDVYLRETMDEHGWVSIFLIADFKRVKQLTDDVQFILDVLKSSDVVEVQGDRIRKRHGWSDWILNPQQNLSNKESDSQSQTATNQQSLVSQMESITLGEACVEGNGENCPLDDYISVP